MSSIDNIVLRYDRRRIGRLRHWLGNDLCEVAADYILDHSNTVLINTGFVVANAQRPETDGPPGAVTLGQALGRLGYDVQFVTDDRCAEMMEMIVPKATVHVMPTDIDDVSVQRFAQSILYAADPSLLLAVERCGPDRDGKYLQFDGTDITEMTGKTDRLFGQGIPSIGFIDGGNEIGVGSVAQHVADVSGLPASPCIVATDRVVLGSVVNWACYGVIAALSLRTGFNLLPSIAEETRLREDVVRAGAVEGESGERIPAVDGIPSELNSLILKSLHHEVEREL
ncbi:glutamate cyclase domain-containing protein [Nesterenkonia muleiensis]|uniref:glutamate cyclase domain-containing protein n=1 Tax=Nesterenkonia muleiensis TaxID=2282648 RepID=UPI000E7217A9|nr:glutamate cyclase domain-containing protein [Nesterenkonia muleiensis]